jgi:hypothetical protein
MSTMAYSWFSLVGSHLGSRSSKLERVMMSEGAAIVAIGLEWRGSEGYKVNLEGFEETDHLLLDRREEDIGAGFCCRAKSSRKERRKRRKFHMEGVPREDVAKIKGRSAESVIARLLRGAPALSRFRAGSFRLGVD